MAAIASCRFHLDLAALRYPQHATFVPTKRRSPVRRTLNKKLEVLNFACNKKKIRRRMVVKRKVSLSSSCPGLFLLSSMCTKARLQKSQQKVREAATTLLAMNRGETMRAKWTLAEARKAAALKAFPLNNAERPRLILHVCLKTLTAYVERF